MTSLPPSACLGTPLAEIRSYLTRRSPEALMDLLREKEADWEAERRRLARMGAFLHNAKDKMALARDRPAGGDSAGDLSGGPLCGGGGAGFCTCKI